MQEAERPQHLCAWDRATWSRGSWAVLQDHGLSQVTDLGFRHLDFSKKTPLAGLQPPSCTYPLAWLPELGSMRQQLGIMAFSDSRRLLIKQKGVLLLVLSVIQR